MESKPLTAFYQSVVTWPGTDAELALVADRVQKFLGVPFVAIHRLEPAPGRTSVRFPGPAPLNGDSLEELMRRKVRQAEGLFSGSGVEVHGLREGPELSGLTHLYVASISGEPRPSFITGRMSPVGQDFGRILVGTASELDSGQEAALLVAAQRLTSLAELCAYEKAIQLRSQFLSIASHELKTPLTSIYGILQLQERILRLKKDEPLQVREERQESYLKMVIRQVQRLNELIDGLLDVSRIQNNRFMVEPSDTDVATLTKETLAARVTLIAQEAGVKLNYEGPETLRAWVDPVRMEEVVTNLVMNAIRFSPEGGVVWIRLRDDNGLMRLTIRDQGPAVPVEDRERIFQPFERAQRTSRFGGLGLGLFISRQIAQLHGGNVGLVESLPGKGNVFEASFPLQSSAAESA